MYVKVNKSSGLIEYDDNVNCWEGDIIFRADEKDVVILGSAHKLTCEERSNIITEILNKYFFGNYMEREDFVYMYKLKNRNFEKKEELNIKGKSFPMLAEAIIELPKNEEESEHMTHFRSIYNQLKLAVEEAKAKNKNVIDYIDYEFYGNYFEYRKYRTIIANLLPDFEYSLSKKYDKNIVIEGTSKYKRKKSIFSFRIKEA